MRSVRMLLMAMTVALVPCAVQAQPVAQSTAPMTIKAQSTLPAPAPKAPLAPLSLLGFALVGATEKAKTKKVNLSRSYLFDNQTYGPGNDIVVPEGFPDIDGETGDVIWPEGTRAAANQARARSFSTPPNTGGVNTGENNSAASNTAELEGMTKEELQEEAEKRGLTVTRGDGGDGEPLKADYIKALST
jgi:hypothetical protein